jgi:hypothetical protein
MYMITHDPFDKMIVDPFHYDTFTQICKAEMLARFIALTVYVINARSSNYSRIPQ